MPEYTPPSNDAVDFALESYSPPNSDAVDFSLAAVQEFGAPQNLTVTDDTTEGELSLSWDPVPDATDYNVYQSTSSTGPFTIVGGTSSQSDTDFTNEFLDDGTEYHYYVTAFNSQDGESDPSNQVSAVTVLPAATGLSADSSDTQITLSWMVNANNGQQAVEYRESGASVWQTWSSGLPLSTTEETVTGLTQGEDYELRVVTSTPDATSPSAILSASTRVAFSPSRVSTTGWSVRITHPVTGRTIRPDAINPDQVQFIPGPNTMPRIRMPVRRAPSWLGEEFDDNPEMTVHLDGEQLPIDELVNVEQEEGQTILVGEGGAELRTTVQKEYAAEERPTAATDLVSNNTSYAVVDNTEAAQPDTIEVQSPSGETALLNALSAADDFPIVATNGGVKPAVTNYLSEGEDTTTEFGTSLSNVAGYSSEFALRVTDTGHSATWEFTTDYDIPESAVSFYVRDNGQNTPEVTFRIDNVEVDVLPAGVSNLGLGWTDVATGPYGGGSGWSNGTLEAGTYELEIDVTGPNGDYYDADVVCLLDNRFSYTFDNDLNTTNGYLDGPELHPPSLDAVFDAYESAFSVEGGSATATLNDTSGAQALALSNDFGSTYPITASNSSTVSGTFPSSGAALNLRATLSRYSPSGAQNATPRFGYDAQRLDAYTLDADVVAESLLINETYGNSLDEVLNQILGSQYGWTITNEDGTTTFTVDEPGSTVAGRDPEISEATVQKKVQTYRDVTIKGSSLPVSGETFTASSSFVTLVEDDILTGSEAVYDASGTQYQRGVDYSINYTDGEIRALSGGDLSTGTDYSIDYRHQIKATYTSPNATGDELVRTIPGVVSDRQAEQIAYVLAEVYPGVSTPRYEGQIVVPRVDVTFDPLEGLQLEDMDLPAVATPLSIRGEPQLTPRGLSLRLGSAPRLEESLSNISNQVSSLSDRS